VPNTWDLVRATPEGNEASTVVAARVVVTQYADGSMSVSGPMHDPEWVLAALEHACDAARTRAFAARRKLLLPAGQVDAVPK
jgi:hypothetical protein